MGCDFRRGFFRAQAKLGVRGGDSHHKRKAKKLDCKGKKTESSIDENPRRGQWGREKKETGAGRPRTVKLGELVQGLKNGGGKERKEENRSCMRGEWLKKGTVQIPEAWVKKKSQQERVPEKLETCEGALLKKGERRGGLSGVLTIWGKLKVSRAKRPED